MKPWFKISISQDGTKLAACENYGSIFTSSDGGVIWKELIVVEKNN